MIENPNSCGQGYDADHTRGLFSIIAPFGYRYSHSTPVYHEEPDSEHTLRRVAVVYHTFKRGEHTVTWWERRAASYDFQWSTSVRPGSGRYVPGSGAGRLQAHLKSKARRYPELRIAKEENV